jgi:hypothetical protein
VIWSCQLSNATSESITRVRQRRTHVCLGCESSLRSVSLIPAKCARMQLHARWRRLAEERAGAKSVFHFDVPGSVAKSTHAGLPWLQYLRKELGSRVHMWPFDGWSAPAGNSLLAEAYPSLWSKTYPMEQLSPDQHDAYTIAAWLSQGMPADCS